MLKRSILILVALLVGIAFYLGDAIAEEPKQQLSIDVSGLVRAAVPFAFDIINVEYERALNKNSTLSLRVFYGTTQEELEMEEKVEAELTSFGLGASY